VCLHNLQGVGSGFVWDEEGHVVTNYHVINDSANVKVGEPER